MRCNAITDSVKLEDMTICRSKVWPFIVILYLNEQRAKAGIEAIFPPFLIIVIHAEFLSGIWSTIIAITSK